MLISLVFVLLPVAAMCAPVCAPSPCAVGGVRANRRSRLHTTAYWTQRVSVGTGGGPPPLVLAGVGTEKVEGLDVAVCRVRKQGRILRAKTSLSPSRLLAVLLDYNANEALAFL